MSDKVLWVGNPLVQDVKELHHMIMSSTEGKSHLNHQRLYQSLFGSRVKSITEGSFGIDNESADAVGSMEPSCYAFLAKLDNVTVGYIIFHYHYSPWLGHSAYIDDIYVVETERSKGKRLSDSD